MQEIFSKNKVIGGDEYLPPYTRFARGNSVAPWNDQEEYQTPNVTSNDISILLDVSVDSMKAPSHFEVKEKKLNTSIRKIVRHNAHNNTVLDIHCERIHEDSKEAEDDDLF